MFVVTDEGVLVADGQGSVAGNERPRRRDQESDAEADHDGRDRVGSRRSHRRQRVLPRRRVTTSSIRTRKRFSTGSRGSRRKSRAPQPLDAAGRRRAGRRQKDPDDGRRADSDPVPRPRAHRRRPRRLPAAREDPVPQRDLPEPRLPRDALGLSQRVAESARSRRSDASATSTSPATASPKPARSRRRRSAPITRR